MPDNSADNLIQLLVQYMDGELTHTERAAVENMLKNDAVLYERYQQLSDVKQAIKSHGLKQKVQALHRQYINELDSQTTQKITPVKKGSFNKTFLRIAAIFFIVMGGYGLFQYTSTTTVSVFNDNYIDYNLSATRSAQHINSIDSFYNAGDYAGVIKTYNSLSQKDQKVYFVAAQAYLHLNNTDAAINCFKQIEAINQANNKTSFSQETDYYLGLAYIKSGNINAAKKQFDKIKANPQHMFYAKAKEISNIELYILRLKNK